MLASEAATIQARGLKYGHTLIRYGDPLLHNVFISRMGYFTLDDDMSLFHRSVHFENMVILYG